MNKTTIQKNGHTIADIISGEPLITDVQSALDLLMTAGGSWELTASC